MTISLLSWIGILFCLTGSAICSGLTLGFFSLSRIHLELSAKQGDKTANTILQIRQDANFLLATLLWSNVAVNVLLTLLAEDQMVGLMAFFSRFVWDYTFWGNSSPSLFFTKCIEIGSEIHSGGSSLADHLLSCGQTISSSSRSPGRERRDHLA